SPTMVTWARENPRRNRSVSNNGHVLRLASSFCRIEAMSAGSVASFKAKASYSSRLRVTSSGRPTAPSRLAATRPTKLSPMHVSTGSPTQSASLAAVCALTGIVEEEIRQAVARYVLGYLHPWRENETRRSDAAGARLTAEVACCGLARVEQPQYAALDLAQEAHPHIEELRRELVAVVETAEHEAILGKAGEPARRHFLCDLAFGVVDPVAVRQMHDFFAVML